MCENSTMARDGYFTTYYVINKILFHTLEAKLNMDLESSLKRQLSSLHEEISSLVIPVFPSHPWSSLVIPSHP